MDKTEYVKAMYEKHPFPSPIVGDTLIPDESNMMYFLFPEQDLAGKRVLDAGCGTGHRFLQMAKSYPEARFVGIDIAHAALEVARSLAQKHAIENVRFLESNLLELDLEEEFDIIVASGVIHHLDQPELGLRNLCDALSDEGIMVIWLYHTMGEHRRLLERELVLTLWGKEAEDRTDLSCGLLILEELGLSLRKHQYGIASQVGAEEFSQRSLDVDAYLHPIVNAYRFEDAFELFSNCSVDWIAANGMNMINASKLIDLAEVEEGDISCFCMNAEDLFDSEELRRRYRELNNLDKLKASELKLEPTGITVIAGRNTSYSMLGRRIEGNRVALPRARSNG